MPSHYIYGLDPASKHDYFGIVVHAFSDEPEAKLPKLKAVNKLTHLPFDEIMEYLVNNLFRRYQPYRIVIDYTNEKTFSDLLVSKYGKSRVELISFTTDNKLMLKQDTLSVLEQGYKFPNPSRLKDPKVAQYVRELIIQLQHEQILTTKTGKTTFDHPSGQNNDLAIAFELSMHGCQQFMLKRDRYLVTAHRRMKHDTEDPYADFGSAIPTRLESKGSAIYLPS